MDMFWTDLATLRATEPYPPTPTASKPYCGRQWRRFSWHRNGIWNPTGNGLLDHFDS
jgi:Prokaryotic E2 family E